MLASNRHIEADNKCVSMEEINNRDCLRMCIFFYTFALFFQRYINKLKTSNKMKAIKLFLCCLVAVLFASCAGVNTTPYQNKPVETKVLLSEANYKIVGQAEGEWSAIYIFGIGGLSKKALTTNAISEMYKNANLTGNQQIINITTTTSIENWVVYSKHRAIARGYIIEFDK